MYIERKAGQLTGPARIGRVTFSKTGKTIYYQGQQFRSREVGGGHQAVLDAHGGHDLGVGGFRQGPGPGTGAGSTPVLLMPLPLRPQFQVFNQDG